MKSLDKLILKKIAQEIPKTKVKGTNPLFSKDISQYKSYVLTLSGVNNKLFSELIWTEISKFIGILDQLLSVYSDNMLNFKSLVINNQTINSALYPNNVGMTDIIKLSNYIFDVISNSGENYNKKQIDEIIKNIENILNSSSITSSSDSRIPNLLNPKGDLKDCLNKIKTLNIK